MKLQNFLFSMITCAVFAACSNDDYTPEDADDNFITAVTITVNGDSYDALIAGNTITMTIPYTMSLNGGTATFVYTSSAQIMPDPSTITDWDTERTFRVTSYNGATNDYTYVVVKDDIRYEGNVELKTQDDVASFVDTGTTIIKGDLIIGSDDEDAEEFNDIAALEVLKEVEGDIIIRKSFTGGTLTGLDNITSIGGLKIGTEENSSNLEMASMANLISVTGDVSIYGSKIQMIEFENLETVEGGIVFDNIGQLSQILLPKLKEAGSIEFNNLPSDFSVLNIPELTTVEGDFNIGAVQNVSGIASAGNTGLTSISGLEKLSKVGGTLTITRFEELASLPDFSNLTQLGGLYIRYNNAIESIDISNADIIGTNGVTPRIYIQSNMSLTEVKTKEDLTGVDFFLDKTDGLVGVAINITAVNDLYYRVPVSFNMESLEKVYGNFMIEGTAGSVTSISLPNLTSVDGYLSTNAYKCTSFSMPSLTTTGGQLHLELSTDTNTVIDLPALKSVCSSDNPQYATDETEFATQAVSDYSLFCVASAAVEFPALEFIYGKGLHIRSPKNGFSAEKLKSVNRLYVQGTFSSLIPEDLSMPALESLYAVEFYLCSKFDDFTFFGKFIDNEMITEENWSVTRCAYNPTYQDMVEGRYTAETAE